MNPTRPLAAITGLLVCCALALPLWSCGKVEDEGPGQGPAQRLSLAVVPKGTTHEFWKSVHAGARRAADELDVEIIWKGPDPENDRDAQYRVVNTFVAKGVDGIVLAPADERALVPAVEDAVRRGVPTVVIDSGLKTDGKVSFVATDNFAGGELGGRHLGKLLGGKGKVILLRFLEGSASTMAREAGFMKVMAEEFPEIEIVSDNQYGSDTEKAFRAAETLLLAHQELDGVFCPNETTTLGMLRGLQDSARAGKVKFVGFDAIEKLIQGMASGEIHGLVLQDPVDMGYQGVKTIVAHLRGETVPAQVSTRLILATSENMNEPDVARLLRPDLSILDK